jgi:tellurite resistance protein TehA-like permease
MRIPHWPFFFALAVMAAHARAPRKTIPDDSKEARETEEEARKQRLNYLLEIYKLYLGHINTMFNYFLIIAGLIATAYVQSMNAATQIDKAVPSSISLFGAFISYIALRIHIRSRDMLDQIESGLRREEEAIFQPGGGFLMAELPRRGPLGRHKYQFRATYWAFVFAFLVMAAYAWALRQGADVGKLFGWLLSR